MQTQRPAASTGRVPESPAERERVRRPGASQNVLAVSFYLTHLKLYVL